MARKSGGKIRGKKKLAKLLYFVDFDFFEKKEASITNDVYCAFPMGPLPQAMDSVVSEMGRDGLIQIEKVPTGSGLAETEVYTALSEPDVSVFNNDEIEILDRVVEKYTNLNGKQLEDLSHAEAPYLATEPFQEIAYELAFYRDTDFNNGGA